MGDLIEKIKAAQRDAGEREVAKHLEDSGLTEKSSDAALRDVADAVCKHFKAAGITPLIGSPNPLEDLHAMAVLALGGSVTREHISSVSCWCSPEIDFIDPVTGAVVYAHRQTQ